MAKKNRVSLDFSGFDEICSKLDGIGGNLKQTTETALVKSKAVVTVNLVKATKKANYPAQGKYSSGDLRHSIDTDKQVNWSGTVGEIHVGFDFAKSGLTSIMIMYGTPRMNKVQSIYDAVYGNKTKKQVRKVQEEIFTDAIKKKMEG